MYFKWFGKMAYENIHVFQMDIFINHFHKPCTSDGHFQKPCTSDGHFHNPCTSDGHFHKPCTSDGLFINHVLQMVWENGL